MRSFVTFSSHQIVFIRTDRGRNGRGKCHVRWRRDWCREFRRENLRERNNLEDLGVYGRTVLKWIIKA